MAVFSEVQLTAAGRALMTKAQEGTKFSITNVAVGDGKLSTGESVEDLTELKNRLTTVSCEFENTVIQDNSSQIEVNFKVSSGTTEFTVREIGIYAKEDDGDEILYAYTNAGDKPDYMPATTTAAKVYHEYGVILAVGNAENVTLDAITVLNYYYGVCDTERSESVKTVTINGLGELEDGVRVTIKFTNGLTVYSAKGLQIKINDFDALDVRRNGVDGVAGYGKDEVYTDFGGTISFIYCKNGNNEYLNIDAPEIVDSAWNVLNKITEGNIADGAVTEAKIEDGAITNAKLAVDSVTSTNIKDESIGEEAFEDGAVTTDKIADEAITTAKIKDANVTEAKIADGAITQDKISDGGVLARHLNSTFLSTLCSVTAYRTTTRKGSVTLITPLISTDTNVGVGFYLGYYRACDLESTTDSNGQYTPFDDTVLSGLTALGITRIEIHATLQQVSGNPRPGAIEIQTSTNKATVYDSDGTLVTEIVLYARGFGYFFVAGDV